MTLRGCDGSLAMKLERFSMFRALWFAVKVGLLVVVAVWVANRPGYIEASWLGYDIRADVGFALLVFVGIILLCLVIYRILLELFNLPKNLRRYNRKKQDIKGRQALTLGLSAVAAGDVKTASYQAHRMRQLLPDDKGLSLLLEAQASRLQGDDKAAHAYFEELVKDKDTAFLGLRGMMLAAIENADIAQALSLAKKARALHPKQPWILRMVYSLELRTHEWAAAERTLQKARKYNAISKEQADSDLMAIYLFRGDKALDDGNKKEALGFLKKAHKIAPDFSPTVTRLAEFYFKQNKNRNVGALINKAWQSKPHPDIANLWNDLGIKNRPDRLSIVEAMEGEEGKIWSCKETGRIYERWSAIAEPHGSFNTIVWDYPQSVHDRAIADRTELLVTAPASVS